MNLYFILRLWRVNYTFIVAIKGQPEFKALNKFSPTQETALIAFTLLPMHSTSYCCFLTIVFQCF